MRSHFWVTLATVMAASASLANASSLKAMDPQLLAEINSDLLASAYSDADIEADLNGDQTMAALGGALKHYHNNQQSADYSHYDRGLVNAFKEKASDAAARDAKVLAKGCKKPPEQFIKIK